MARAAGAGSVLTVDGKDFEGDVRFNDSGGLTVQKSGGLPVDIPLSNIVRAAFSSGPFLSSGSVLPNGWSIQDVGETRGSTRLEGDAFTMNVEGQSTNAATCHFAGRAMHSDGEISCRVDEVAGANARGGIMLRARDGSVFASLACDGRGAIWFERRPDTDRKSFRANVVATMKPPVWLRLYKRDRFIVPSVSQDGSVWQTVGRDSTKLVMERTWREHEGELNLLRASFGVFAASRAMDTWATARVSRVAMTLNGLLGEYFADDEFKKLAFTRLDPQVRFDWRSSRPDPLLAGPFSVRWTGTLVPLRSGTARIFFEGDDEARLWINNEPIREVSLQDRGRALAITSAPAITLAAGQPLNIKMEVRDRAAPAFAKLAWALQKTPETISMTNFVFRFMATNSPDRTAGHREEDAPAVHGVLLRDGTFIAGPVSAADESAVRLSFVGRRNVPVLTSRVARIVVRPPRLRLDYDVALGRTGVFLKNGDFLESEFRNILHGSLNMSSVLFGAKRFWLEGGDATVAVLNDCHPQRAAAVVSLLDGSVVRAASLTANGGALTLEEPVLGSMTIPAADIWKIDRAASSATFGE